MSASSTVTSIVISYYTGPLLARALLSLSAQSRIDEIILIDNGNPAGTIEQALDKVPDSPPVRVLTGHGNIGFAAACNLGAREARGDYLLFLNPDALMPEGALAQMLTDGAALERPWMLGPMLVDPDGREQQGSRRETLTPWRAFVEASRIYKLAPRHPYFRRFNLHQDEAPEKVSATPTISGACFLIPREDYNLIDGMDERYFLHVEDIDFCVRLRKAGGRVRFTPHVKVVHFKSSSRANPVRIEARKTAGLIRFFHTHFEEAYPKPFLWLVDAALWALFGLLVARRAVGWGLRLIGLRRRAGARGARRARAIAAKRQAR